MERLCLECGSSITGRSDKKFCDDACRTAYHNRIHKEDSDFIRNVQSILRKNRKILSDLYSSKDFNLSKEFLILQGFNFDFHTNSSSKSNGKNCYYCFDYGYLIKEDGRLEIMKQTSEPDY